MKMMMDVRVANPSVNSTLCQQEIKTDAQTTIDTCPQFQIVSLAKWSYNDKTAAWVWTNPTTQWNATVPTKPPHMQRRLDKNETSIVFYGSSHLRELYFSLIRLKRSISFATKLEDVVIKVGSGSLPPDVLDGFNQTICDPHKTGFLQGLYGVNLVHCGPPGKRLVPELGDNIAIGFKTLLHTPQAEDFFVDFLTRTNLRNPSILVVDVGIWGPRGNKTLPGTLDTVLSPTEELVYYLDWIQATFLISKIVYIYENVPHELRNSTFVLESLEATIIQKSNAFLLRKDLLQQNMPPRMPCGHGCAGPVTHVMADLVLDWLTEATFNGCIQ